MCKAAVACSSLFHHIQSCCHNSRRTPGSLGEVLSKGFPELQLEALKSNPLVGGTRHARALAYRELQGRNTKRKKFVERLELAEGTGHVHCVIRNKAPSLEWPLPLLCLGESIFLLTDTQSF